MASASSVLDSSWSVALPPLACKLILIPVGLLHEEAPDCYINWHHGQNLGPEMNGSQIPCSLSLEYCQGVHQGQSRCLCRRACKQIMQNDFAGSMQFSPQMSKLNHFDRL